jgi:pyruvate/2-oxoglutarate/acetoin dehydrogenase E1 component
MRVLVIVSVLFAFAFAAQRSDTLRVIKADTVITYDTTLIVKSVKDTSIVVHTDTISKTSKVAKKISSPKKEEIKIIVPAK